MEITPKLRKLIYGMFDDMIEGADKYVTKSSTWLIFTEEKRWVIEFTNTKTLWFNYNLFQSELNLLSMDCVDSKDIIKEWFESRFLEKDIAHVTDTSNVPYSIVEDTIQNGVKDTRSKSIQQKYFVEHTIQNGVKNSQSFGGESLKLVEDTIQNGVKETIVGDGNVTCYSFDMDDNIIAEDVIQNGVKDILGWNFNMRQDNVEDSIENGVKETIGTLRRTLLGVDDIIQNGVKEVKSVYLRSCLGVGDAIQNGVKDIGARHLRVGRKVNDVIQNGVKEVKHKMAESYQQKDHMVTNAIITEDINYAIENGIKE
jgi:hypothetical protein